MTSDDSRDEEAGFLLQSSQDELLVEDIPRKDR